MFKYEMRVVDVRLTKKGLDRYIEFYRLNYGFDVSYFLTKRCKMSVSKLKLIFNEEWKYYEVVDWNPKGEIFNDFKNVVGSM